MYLKLAKARKYLATDSFVLVSNVKLHVIETDSFLFCYVLYLINILLRFFFVIEKKKRKKKRKNSFLCSSGYQCVEFKSNLRSGYACPYVAIFNPC